MTHSTVSITYDGGQPQDTRCKHYPLPSSPELGRLLRGDFDPQIGSFEVRTTRNMARNLRRHFFGPKGLKKVPRGAGVMEFDLPCGWTMRLHYGRPGNFEKAGDVTAEFIPPKPLRPVSVEYQRPSRERRL